MAMGKGTHELAMKPRVGSANTKVPESSQK
jgi:hypothetical protein